MTPIAKIEILLLGPFGWMSWLAGMITINRSKPSNSIAIVNNAFIQSKHENFKLLVFPEGTRHNTGQIHKFKKGAFMAAVQAKLPILPVVFSSYKTFLDSDNKIFNSSEITVTVMDEISTDELTAADVDELIDKTRVLMTLQFDQMSEMENERI